METYQKEFIELALEKKVLEFGRYTLKSGRVSPYFFNAGKFDSGKALAKLGRAYAEALIRSEIEFDMLLGPAYKGIPLAATTSVALSDIHMHDIPYCYNRKEAKNHGEGGTLVGAPLQGNIVIVDDVITAGTAVREVLSMIEEAGATPAAVVVGLNRQERGKGEKSAIQELVDETGIPVVSIINLDHILTFLADSGDNETLEQVSNYRNMYGV